MTLHGLYVIIDKDLCSDLLETTKKIVAGRANIIQLRYKNADENEVAETAKKMKQLIPPNIPFIINDYVNIAKKVNADGVHLGMNDTSIEYAREILGKEKIIGASVYNLEEAVNAEKDGADYLGVGSIFPTNSKKDAKASNLENLSKIKAAVKIPVFAIGGINQENAYEVINYWSPCFGWKHWIFIF